MLYDVNGITRMLYHYIELMKINYFNDIMLHQWYSIMLKDPLSIEVM